MLIISMERVMSCFIVHILSYNLTLTHSVENFRF